MRGEEEGVGRTAGGRDGQDGQEQNAGEAGSAALARAGPTIVSAGGMDELNDQSRVLVDVGERLNRLGAAWMLTGSLASAFHGEPRMTRDIDVVVELGALRSEAFRAAFAEAYYVPEEGLREALEHGTMLSLLHLDTGVKVDFIPRRDGEFHRTEFARREQVSLFGRLAWVVSAEDLVIAKLSWAADTKSETQLRDIRGVLANPHDRAYIESWVQRLGLEATWQAATKFER